MIVSRRRKARRILIDFIAYLKLANDFYSKNISLKRAFENVFAKRETMVIYNFGYGMLWQ